MGEPALAGPLRGTCVLLVEDHEDARDLFTSMLEYAGAFVLSAASVDEALRISRGVRVDVIVTDIGLRPRPGTWFVEDGRYAPRFSGVPVIAVTGRDIPPSLRAMFEAVIDKPVDAEALTAAILRSLG